MEFTQEEIDLFDRFTEGKMSEGERKDFLVSMEDDKELKSRFEAYQTLTSAIVEHGREEATSMVETWEQEYTRQNKWYRNYTSIAAAVSVLVVASLMFWFQVRQNNVERYFKPFPDVLTSRGGDVEKLEEAMIAYDKEDYETALERFAVLNKGVNDPLISFYSANCLIAESSYEEAILILENLDKKMIPSINADVDWYLSLACLGAKRQKLLEKKINEILIDTNHAYHDQANKLKTEIFKP